MATFTYTATSSDLHFGYTDYTWGYGNCAFQGNNGTGEENTAQRIGIIVFNGAGSALKDKEITSITLTFEFGQAGIDTGGAYKTIKMYKSNYQEINDDVYRPPDYLNTNNILGALDTEGYDNTDTFILNSSSNTELFNNLASYLSSGNSAVVIYNNANERENFYSLEYLQIRKAIITVTYNDLGLIYIDNVTSFEAYQVYVDNGTSWDLYIPYIDNGSDWDLYG